MSIASEAHVLETTLGDPALAGPLSRAQVVACDEAEAFPIEAWNTLLATGYFDGFLSVDLGGTLHAFDRLLALGRVVARRDLTTAISLGQSMSSALSVFIGGDDAQRAMLAERLRRGETGALALTEEARGSDLLAIQTTARRDGDAYVLDGTKWAINNASRASFLVVLARTGEPSVRGLSLFLLDKDVVDRAACTPTPKLRTHGIRGADISGVTLSACRIPERMRIGREGDGFSLVQTAMQVSRTMGSMFALGAADTALRIAFDFATARALYGSNAWALPAVRAELRGAFVSLMLADALAIFASRALSLLPDQMSVLSAVTKVAVPERALDTIRRASVVLGARHYMREGRYALFQKILRDAPLVALFDGSSAVNRSLIAEQLPRLVGARLDETGRTRLMRCAALQEAAPRFQIANLQPTNRGADDVLSGLDEAVSRLANTASSATCLRLDALQIAYADFAADVARLGTLDPRGDASQGLADRYVALATAAVLVHVHAGKETGTADDDALLSLGIDSVLQSLGVRHGHKEDAAHAERIDALLRTYSRDGLLYSHMPITLAESLAREA